MPMFQKVEEFLAYFKNVLETRYRPTEGALFSAVVALDREKWSLAAGRALFLDAPAVARPAVKYAAIRVVEEWVSTEDAAFARLEQVLLGRGAIGGEPIPADGFRHTQEEQHWGWRPKLTGWTESLFKSEPTIPTSGNRPSVTKEPVTGFGLPPFVSGSHVVHEWFYGDRSRERHSSEPNDLGAFLTVLPDTRARIVEAEWGKGMLKVRLEANVPREQLELQCIFTESTLRRDAIVRAPADEVELEVPEDAQLVTIYLLHSSGAHLGQATVSRFERTFEESAPTRPVEEQAATDIENGENDEVEFKPYLKLSDEKMSEVLETVVAFANTRGGRLYLGVDDHRRVEGRSALSRALGAKEEDARAELERAMNKIITDKVKPVPRCVTRFVDLYGEPVFVVSVERGDQRPYATFNNQIFIRKGSSNVNPDPTTELRQLLAVAGDGIVTVSQVLGRGW